jgi:pimeloyl-ACP methyl ester carboxylesterase
MGLAGGAALVTARHLLTTPQPLENGLPGEGRVDRAHGGEMYYTVAGPTDARPVVLLHGFYPGASNYEYHAIFSRLAETNRVYAPDWLGFGMSERPTLSHTGEFYSAMLAGFLRDVVGTPAAVVAHGRAANIATRVAADAPNLFDRLTLVAPEAELGMRPDPTLGQTVARLFQKVSLGITPYAILTLRPALRLAASRRSAVGPMEVDEQTLDHLYASAHQFGGEYAALALLTGELDLPIRQVFPLMRTPTLIIVGARDQERPLDTMEGLVALNPRADLEMIANAGETVFLDQPTLFVHTLHRWLARRVTRHEPVPQVAQVARVAQMASTAQAAPAVPVTLATSVASPALTELPSPPTPTEQPSAAPPVKIVPVLEDSAQRRPREARVLRSPDDAALADTADPTRVSQPLALEPDEQPRSESAGPSARFTMPQPRSTRAAPPSATAFHYAPESHAHIMRSDRGGGRSTRHR